MTSQDTNMSHSPEMRDTLNMTAGTVGRDLLSALVLEMKMMPSIWAKMSQKKQDDIIERLRNRVDTAVKMAVHLIAANGRTVLQGDLDKVTIHNGTQATIKFGKAAPGLLELATAQGQAVLLVVSGNPETFTGGMDEVRGEADQRGLDLGREYADDDGAGMPPATDGDDVVDAEFKVLGIDHQPLQDELNAAFEAGATAAAEGKPESACPVMAGPLCIEWVKGWKAWREDEHPEVIDELYDQAVECVRADGKVSISKLRRQLQIGNGRAVRLVEEMERRCVVSPADADGQRTVIGEDDASREAA
ncbi:Ftsk gamma domain-containing protein [Cupriavidus sp. OV038]|uniref:DNA translocase FtsK n=1 Tax=unclassified Cupriavidus TaxID=2640874 RepID=UPI0008EEE1BD|nr:MULTISPECIES: DNA translocase FtsK [unclassified Cupriavidus]SFB68922.1 Ftsk gamma domain-containing protein [Cupriavidus sp. OV038]SFO58318.1 Ftsk gamma domain-containing protein [Cupriavidus sp. OV096]